MNIKSIPFKLDSSLWMTVGEESFGGRGRIALLAKVAECGSITQAAKEIKMSYKAAWDAIDKMNTLAGEPLVERVSGGKGGGGTRLTARGEQLIKNFALIEKEHRCFIEHLSQQAQGITDDFILMKKISMKTSARNQFFGKISQITHGSVNDEIELDIVGGNKIIAIITHDSKEDLGLHVGSEAFALIKASSIIVVTDVDNAKFSARNQLSGTVTRVIPGAVNSDVQIELQGGLSIAAIITNESCANLELAVGADATGIFKASSVILGVPV